MSRFPESKTDLSLRYLLGGLESIIKLYGDREDNLVDQARNALAEPANEREKEARVRDLAFNVGQIIAGSKDDSDPVIDIAKRIWQIHLILKRPGSAYQSLAGDWFVINQERSDGQGGIVCVMHALNTGNDFLIEKQELNDQFKKLT